MEPARAVAFTGPLLLLLMTSLTTGMTSQVEMMTSSLESLSSADPAPLVTPGDVILGVLADLHGPASNATTASPALTASKAPSTAPCTGPLSLQAMEGVGAVDWAVATLNNQSSTRDIRIGVAVYDTCGDADVATRQTFRLVSSAERRPLLGVLGLSSSDVLRTSQPGLHAFQVPLLVTSPSAAEALAHHSNVFSTAPRPDSHCQAVLKVLQSEGVNDVWVVSSRATWLDHFLRRAEEDHPSLTVRSLLVLPEGEVAEKARALNSFVRRNLVYGGVVTLLAQPRELNALVRQFRWPLVPLGHVAWVIAAMTEVGGPREQVDVRQVAKVLGRAVLVQPHAPRLPGFSAHFAHALTSEGGGSLLQKHAREYIEEVSNCRPERAPKKENEKLPEGEVCKPPDAEELEVLVGSGGGGATQVVKGVSSLAAALSLVLLDRCSSSEDNCFDPQPHPLHADLGAALTRLSYPVGGERIRYTADGRILTTFTIGNLSGRGLYKVGVYREDTGVVWREQRPQPRENEPVAEASVSGRRLALRGREESIVRRVLSHRDYVRRPWACAVLGAACAGVLAALLVGVYVALRACDGTITGPQVLGSLLLLGVLVVFASCVLFVLPPTPLGCLARIYVPPAALALCYGVLLAKAMQLRAFVSLGLGGKVSQLNLYVCLVFIVAVQVLLSTLTYTDSLQAFADDADSPTEAPTAGLVLLADSGLRQCVRAPRAGPAGAAYLLALLLLGLGLAITNRNIRRNHDEGRWLLLTTCVSTPVVTLWGILSHAAPLPLRDPTDAAALLALATIILALIFGPKLGVIAKQAKHFRHTELKQPSSVSTLFGQLETASPARLPMTPHPNGALPFSGPPSPTPPSGNAPRLGSTTAGGSPPRPPRLLPTPQRLLPQRLLPPPNSSRRGSESLTSESTTSSCYSVSTTGGGGGGGGGVGTPIAVIGTDPHPVSGIPRDAFLPSTVYQVTQGGYP
ncbi:uncharacterized protein LOC143021211 [Oratosquilla oratoria]|uniref:uncharacterized protein LOC143021211 n=1 Tax=Oratosquilla oratoria TaxID=337810 RepID=UPI003F7757D9